MSGRKEYLCKLCGRPFIWAVTMQDKMMAVDAKPHPKGSFVLIDREEGKRPIVCHEATLDPSWIEEKHTSHFDTCTERKKR